MELLEMEKMESNFNRFLIEVFNRMQNFLLQNNVTKAFVHFYIYCRCCHVNLSIEILHQLYRHSTKGI